MATEFERVSNYGVRCHKDPRTCAQLDGGINGAYSNLRICTHQDAPKIADDGIELDGQFSNLPRCETPIPNESFSQPTQKS